MGNLPTYEIPTYYVLPTYCELPTYHELPKYHEFSTYHVNDIQSGFSFNRHLA